MLSHSRDNYCVKGSLTVSFTSCFLHLLTAFLLLCLFVCLLAEVNFKDVPGETHVSTPLGHLPLKRCPQLLPRAHFPAAPFQRQRLCCRGFVAIPAPAASRMSGSALSLGGEGVFSSSFLSQRWSFADGREFFSLLPWDAVPCGRLFQQPLTFRETGCASVPRSPLLLRRAAAFVCSIIQSSVMCLSYFASRKNSTEIRFDLFPTTEVIVSCLPPRSS